MTTVLGYVDLLERMKLTPEQNAQALESIRQEGRRLHTLSGKLLDLFKIQSGKTLDVKPVNISAMFSRMVETLKLCFKEKNIDVVVDCRVDTWSVDEALFETLLLNLLENACTASSEHATVKLSAIAIQSGAVFSVEDNGHGIPKDEIALVLEPFYMTDKIRTRTQHGSGLGLTLCKTIAEAHNAKLIITSEEQVGTKVSVVFE
jgi:signal transduction histidine kinase